jgi:hypothetical protein
MTQDEIIEMARFAGIRIDSFGFQGGFIEEFKAFAALVAAKALAQRTEPPDWFPAVENILKEYGLQAMDFVADFKEAMKDAEQSQRTWVGLTDDEMEAKFIECGGKWNGDFWKIEDADFHPFLRTIEDQLKQKNGFAKEKQA